MAEWEEDLEGDPEDELEPLEPEEPKKKRRWLARTLVLGALLLVLLVGAFFIRPSFFFDPGSGEYAHSLARALDGVTSKSCELKKGAVWQCTLNLGGSSKAYYELTTETDNEDCWKAKEVKKPKKKSGGKHKGGSGHKGHKHHGRHKQSKKRSDGDKGGNGLGSQTRPGKTVSGCVDFFDFTRIGDRVF